MKIETRCEEYRLTAEAIDRIAEQVEDFLYSIETGRANVLRLRLSIEEALLRWQDRFGEETTVTFSVGSRWRRPVITLALTGESCNPMADRTNDLGQWGEGLLSEVGLSPKYSYQRGVNILQFRLHRHQINPALILLGALAVGLVVGLVGGDLCPPSAREMLIRTTLVPIQDLFYRILNAAAGPVIFFTVLTSVCGFGSVAIGEKNGRKMLLRFITMSTVLTVIALILSIWAFSIRYHDDPVINSQFASVLDFFLHIVPNDGLSPIITGDSPQIILVAVILGNALLAAGTQSGGLVALIEQLNAVCLILGDWVGKLAPFFVVFLLILGLWNKSLWFVLGCWRPLLLFLVLTAAAIIIIMLWVSLTKKVSPAKLIKKVWPSFLVALRTFSVDAAFGDNAFCCEKRLGISKKATAYGLPLGLVIYMPAGTMATMIFTMYAAKSYGIVVSTYWCILAVVLTVALLVATPPMPGIGLLAYSAIFARLGIPAGALAIALLADILFGFVTAAANQVMLQMELILQADGMGQLNTTILRK